VPEVNTHAMGIALEQFSAQEKVGTRKQVIMVVDGAGWHTTAKLKIREGIHLMKLPAATLEMQPAERLWVLLNEGIANKAYNSIEALEKEMARRCKQLMKQEESIRSLTHYHWWPDC
jgi:hypothetical protein